VQSFDAQRFLLAHFEGSAEARKQWEEKLGWFIPTELDPKTPFSELIAGFHDAGRSMQAISRSNCRGLVMPSYNYCKYLTVNKGLVDVKQNTSSMLCTMICSITQTFNVEYPQITIADKLQCLENFDRIDPLPVKCGVMLAKSICNDSYRKFCCIESIMFSMLRVLIAVSN
jgi:hypothetical protein